MASTNPSDPLSTGLSLLADALTAVAAAVRAELSKAAQPVASVTAATTQAHGASVVVGHPVPPAPAHPTPFAAIAARGLAASATALHGAPAAGQTATVHSVAAAAAVAGAPSQGTSPVQPAAAVSAPPVTAASASAVADTKPAG